jgi:hypothetical protein
VDFAVEISLDLWPLVEPLVPLLEELERVEAMAAEGSASGSPHASDDGQTEGRA